MSISIAYAAIISFGLTAFSIVTSIIPIISESPTPARNNIEDVEIKKLINALQLEDSVTYANYIDYNKLLNSYYHVQNSSQNNQSSNKTLNAFIESLKNEGKNQSENSSSCNGDAEADNKLKNYFLLMAIISYHEKKNENANKFLYCYFNPSALDPLSINDPSWYFSSNQSSEPTQSSWYMMRHLIQEDKRNANSAEYDNFVKPEDFSCHDIKNQKFDNLLNDFKNPSSYLNKISAHFPSLLYNVSNKIVNFDNNFLFNNSTNKKTCTYNEFREISSSYKNTTTVTIAHIINDAQNNMVPSSTNAQNIFINYFNLFIICSFSLGPVFFFLGVKYFLE